MPIFFDNHENRILLCKKEKSGNLEFLTDVTQRNQKIVIVQPPFFSFHPHLVYLPSPSRGRGGGFKCLPPLPNPLPQGERELWKGKERRK